MAVSRKDPLPAASAWQLEFVRLIAFPVSPPFFINQQWWQEVGSQRGEQSEDFASTRKKHFRDDRGTLQGVLLALTVDLERVVWEARSPDVVDASGNFPTIGPYREKVDWFVELLSPWLTTSCPPRSACLLCKTASTCRQCERGVSGSGRSPSNCKSRAEPK